MDLLCYDITKALSGALKVSSSAYRTLYLPLFMSLYRLANREAPQRGCKDYFKSTSGGAQFLGENLARWSLKKKTKRRCQPRKQNMCLYPQNRRDLPRDTPLDRIEVLRVILFSIHSDDENPSSVNIKQHCGRIQDKIKAKDQDIKIKSQDIKLNIKIQDHKHAEGSSKEFPRTQGSKTQDVTRSEAISAMTTP
ncbi:hypothetical protein Tco_1209911 [Tanacetum coccineum]